MTTLQMHHLAATVIAAGCARREPAGVNLSAAVALYAQEHAQEDWPNLAGPSSRDEEESGDQ